MTLPTETVYYMRAQDSGTGGKVYWTTVDQYTSPAPSETQPDYTGTLSAIVIVFSKVREIVEVQTRTDALPIVKNAILSLFVANTVDPTNETIIISNYTLQLPPG